MNIKNYTLIIKLLLCFIISLFLSACGYPPIVTNGNTKKILTLYAKEIGQSRQVLLVQKKKNDSSSLYLVYTLEKNADSWKFIFKPMDAVIGKNGFAPLNEKREGDGKTPSGVFSLKQTFGYNKYANTKMPYRQALDDDVWVDDPNAPDYNQWVKRKKTDATSFEEMKRADDQYKYGIVIEYNTNPIIKGHGSAIFLHVWKEKGSPTAGCVAVSENDLIKILSWLDPGANPLIIMGILQEGN